MKREFPVGVRVGDVGLLIERDLPYKEWARVGASIAQARRVMTWAIGDWILYGEARYGEKYTQAIEATGYAPGSLVTMASVCERIPQAMRQADLSFEHHRVVAYLPEGERQGWLVKSVRHAWTREQLREKVGGDTARAVSKRRVTCPKCGEVFVP